MNLAASFDPSLVEDDQKEKDKKKIKANYDGGVVGGQSIAGPLRFKPFITASTKEELDKNTLRTNMLEKMFIELEI